MQGRETRTKRRGRAGTVLAILAVVIVSALAAEIAARTLFGLDTLQYRRPYHPLFVSGDYHYRVPNEDLPAMPDGPLAVGYRQDMFGFHADFDAPPPRTSTTLADFLFSHSLSRYSATEVDRISCEEKDAQLIYVLGGSVAQGFSADTKEDTWHGVLEGLLRARLGRQNIHVFNAAMGAFGSLQEKLAYTLAVVPRPATLVLVVDGYNDLTLPANSAVRAGDPFQLGMRYSQWFSDGFLWWLGRHSAIARTVLEQAFTRDAIEFRARLERDDALFQRQAEAITDIYVENTSEILAACEGRGLACRVVVQPARSLTAEYLGTRVDDILSQRRIVELYRLLLAKVAAGRFHDRYIDMTHVFDRGEKLQHYADSVHPNFAGQQVLARALLAPTMAALNGARKIEPAVDRCAKRR